MAILGKNKKPFDYEKPIPYGFLKIGDIVRLKGREWYDRLLEENKFLKIPFKVSTEHDLCFTQEMECFLGRTFEVSRIFRGADMGNKNPPKEIYKLIDRRPDPIISEYNLTVDEYFFSTEMLEIP